ncbi:uncharacterized protein I303_100949 [Kwoniella dejecticola CBS 10117]|uniref:Serine/threonine protein kinase n=1 Tax=Kwoniella dejecticola CBS 10117 TaxID=1296121 RepID=A0A1A6AGF6_9TREE|nr:serine/threonine protein kinase [Kwoniella dejecticola CBS 10117]OBR89131.1 serine/threonine protein kinase [Kwoniella dejecticola CBS 10117]
MSLLRDTPSHQHQHQHHSILHSPSLASSSTAVSSVSAPTTPHDACKPRSSSSRNDLFTTSWQPEIPPPRPLAGSSLTIAGPSTAGSSKRPASSGSGSLNSIFDLTGTGTGSGGFVGVGTLAHANTLPSSPMRKRGEIGLKMDLEGIDNTKNNSSASAENGGIGIGVDEFGVTLNTKSSFPTVNKNDISPSPRTSSFFDTPSETITPPPAPRLVSSINAQPSGVSSFAPSPLNLSRASSISVNVRKVPPPLPLIPNPSSSQEISPVSVSGANTGTPSAGSSRQRSTDSYTDPLSPLHQSPQLPPSGSAGLEGWKPPLPPSSDDIELRLLPNSTYLLGEGRYARAYLASYKRKRRGPHGYHGYHANDLLSRSGSIRRPQRRQNHQQQHQQQEMEVNEDGDGLIGGSWRLCAAKRLAPDRESQTMGLREAFFLNRLAGPSSRKPSPSTSVERYDSTRRGQQRQRAVSPLRDNHQTIISNAAGSDDSIRRSYRRPCGSVYVVKLIAVKEDVEGFPSLPANSNSNSNANANASHARSSSDILTGTTTMESSKGNSNVGNSMTMPSDLRRQRSSTIITAHAPLPPGGDGGTLPSYPSLPSLAQSARYDQMQSQIQHQYQPSLSRLVLLLEHAPLGTLDRMLRTSPQLVGRGLWERWAREGAEALEWVHGKGVVHADVKPGNLLLTADLHIRLSDFGSSLLIHPDHPPTDGLGLGTLPFSPPELVDPNQTFSFPVDIFALGATLYQCLTGREPFRGIRTVEMMHHVRKGGLWAYEERERFQRVGNEDGLSTAAGSPYPSAWRGYSSTSISGAGYPSGSIPTGGVRRTGSLRVPPSYSREHLAAAVDLHGVPSYSHGHGVKPKLKRMTSAESLRASDEAGSSESPSGVKLYANWVKSGPIATATTTTSASTTTSSSSNNISSTAGVGMAYDAVTRLLSDEDDFASDLVSPTYGISRANSLRRQQQQQAQVSGTSTSVPATNANMNMNTDMDKDMSIPKAIVQIPTPTSPSSIRLPDHSAYGDTFGQTSDQISADDQEYYKNNTSKVLNEAYADGSPSMLFLDGRERVSEEIREVLRQMLSPVAGDRLTAYQVRLKWDELDVGLGEEEEDDGQEEGDEEDR